MSLTIIDFILTRLKLPFIASPRSNYLNVWSKCFDSQLETNLVISFTCSTVADSNGTFFSSNFNKLGCNAWTSHSSTKKIFVLVYGTCLYARNNVVIAEIINDIFNIKLRCTRELSSFLKSV